MKLPINAVPIPSAQTTILSAPPNITTTRKQSQINDIMKSSRLMYNEKLILFIQVCYGCRVSEVLNISVNSISQDGRLVLKGLKGSSDRLIFIDANLFNLDIIFKRYVKLGDYTNRFRLYREVSILQSCYSYGSNKKKSITHGFRHEFVLDLLSTNMSKESISNVLGHKSVKNLKYYESKKNK